VQGLSKIINIGKAVEGQLKTVGITTIDELKKLAAERLG
jgi:predicted flap endonuclease-1-like 5' DNA nuclease